MMYSLILFACLAFANGGKHKPYVSPLPSWAQQNLQIGMPTRKLASL